MSETKSEAVIDFTTIFHQVRAVRGLTPEQGPGAGCLCYEAMTWFEAEGHPWGAAVLGVAAALVQYAYEHGVAERDVVSHIQRCFKARRRMEEGREAND